MRLYGQNGLRSYIRKHIRLAHEFEALIQDDSRFEITAPVTMGLVCFRLKGSNHDNEVLNKLINDEGKIHMTPSKVRIEYVVLLFTRFNIFLFSPRLTKSTFCDWQSAQNMPSLRTLSWRTT